MNNKGYRQSHRFPSQSINLLNRIIVITMYIYLHICVFDVCAHIRMQVCRHACKGPNLSPGFYLCHHPLYSLRQSLSLNSELVSSSWWPDCLVNACFGLLNTGLWVAATAAQLLHGSWGWELQSSHWCDRYLALWAIPSATIEF